jgi:hypothetical protein
MSRLTTAQVATAHALNHAYGRHIARLLFGAALLCGSAGLRFAHAGNMVMDWNNEFLLITQQTSGNLVAGPPDVAREIAQMGAAMSDAVNAATGGNNSSFAYSGTMAGADANVAAATAAYTALSNMFTSPVWSTPIGVLNPALAGNTSNTTLATNIIIPQLKAFLTSELTSLGLSSPATVCASANSALCNGYNLGIAAATAVNNSSTFSPTASGAVAAITAGLTANAPAGSGTTPGVYVPPAARPEMFPTWGGTALTGITSTQMNAAKATVSGPPAITSAAYAAALLQTECQGGSAALSTRPVSIQSACATAGFTQETTAQTKAALFWNDPGTTIQPPGHWLQIANAAMLSQGSSLLQSAQLTALMGEAMNDAGILAWDEKYTNNLWRPVTAIRDCSNWSAANFTTCDASWSSLIATPPHPDYIAGHPAFSGAAATVLERFFGTDNIAFTSTSNYYCNGAASQFDPATNLLASCTVGSGPSAIVYAVSNPSDCAAILDGINSNGSPLICPISETFNSFSDASQGPNGSEFSRVVGGIHTPFSVEDALAAGNFIGQALAQNAGLPELVPEPSSLGLCGIGLLSLTRLRRRRHAVTA